MSVRKCRAVATMSSKSRGRVRALILIGLCVVSAARPTRADEGDATLDGRWILLQLNKSSRVEWKNGALRDAVGGVHSLRNSAGKELRVESVFEAGSSTDLDAELMSARARFVFVRDEAGRGSKTKDELSVLTEVKTVRWSSLPPLSPGCNTPDFTNKQPYLGVLSVPLPFPRPLNVRHIQDIPGGQGQGIGLVDMEYAWRTTHEDLPSTISLVGPTPLVPAGLNAAWEQNHGTATLGVIAAQHNGFGVHGLAPRVNVSIVGSYTDASIPYEVNLARAIDRARQATRVGDIILLEAQIGGPRWTNTATQVGLLPVEWSDVIYTAIRTATSQGRIVVEAAGNGSQNLDDAVYQGKFDVNVRDSGALIVSMVCCPRPVPGQQPNPANSGARIDLSYWQVNVTTCGYGDLQSGGGGDCDYSETSYGASSAASALMAGGISALQGVAIELTGSPLSPVALRALLQATGLNDLQATHGSRPDFWNAAVRMVRDATSVDLLVAGGSSNPSFELPQGVMAGQTVGWAATAGTFFNINAVDSYQGILPTHRDKMLSIKDPSSDGLPAAAGSELLIPQSASSLLIDWHFMTTSAASEYCDTLRADIWLEDTQTRERLDIMKSDLCIGLQSMSDSRFRMSSGWRTSRLTGMSSLVGGKFLIRVSVNAAFDNSGPTEAVLLIDNLRFESSDSSPSISSVDPDRGSVCGKEILVVHGSGFSAADTTVLVGGVRLESIHYVDEETITGETPAGTGAGAKNVEVRSSRGNASLASAYTYETESCQSGPVFIRGETNGDGVVDLSDPISCLSFLFLGGVTMSCHKTCDANDDSSADISDAVFVLSYLFLGGPQPAAPFPACGTDPTADSLSCASSPACP